MTLAEGEYSKLAGRRLGRLNLVQDRPTLGTLTQSQRFDWLPYAVDLAVGVLIVALAGVLFGAGVLPEIVVAPLVLAAAHFLLEFGARPRSLGGSGSRLGNLAVFVFAAAFVWLISLSTGLAAWQQLTLFGTFVAFDTLARLLSTRLTRSTKAPERWLLVGDAATAEQLQGYAPLKPHASVVHTLYASEWISESGDRTDVLEILSYCKPDRVVISTGHADDDSLLRLVRAFRSLGVPVSMLPRPLDLLETDDGVRPRHVGGLPLLEVETRRSNGSPYRGKDRRRDRRPRVSVVIPTLNEERNVAEVLQRLPGGVHEVILVDGNSRDATIEAARRVRPDIKVIHQHGRGKGAALRSGFAAVTGNLIVMLDADGSADPAEIPRFVKALEDGADFAKGSRFVGDGGSDDITPLRRAGNRVLSGTANALNGTNFTDLCYGYNAFWARCLPFMSVDVAGFEVETLINLRVASAGMRITEVPSHEASRFSGQSNLKTFRDGWRVLKTILRESSYEPFSRRTDRPSPSPADAHQQPLPADSGTIEPSLPAQDQAPAPESSY